MLLDWGTLHYKSTKKLNIKISSEAKLAGLSEHILYNLWIVMFINYQAYLLNKNIIYQHNKSTIKMDINGRNSCMGNYRHVNIRYFYK